MTLRPALYFLRLPYLPVEFVSPSLCHTHFTFVPNSVLQTLFIIKVLLSLVTGILTLAAGVIGLACANVAYSYSANSDLTIWYLHIALLVIYYFLGRCQIPPSPLCFPLTISFSQLAPCFTECHLTTFVSLCFCHTHFSLQSNFLLYPSFGRNMIVTVATVIFTGTASLLGIFSARFTYYQPRGAAVMVWRLELALMSMYLCLSRAPIFSKTSVFPSDCLA